MGVLPLNMEHCNYDKHDFCLSPSNIEAYSAINGNIIACLITGAKSSGKTHLAHIWNTQNGGKFLSEGERYNGGDIVIENIENVNQNWLFEIYNAVQNNGCKILLTANNKDFRIDTPDLKSRILSMPHYHIKQADDELLRQIIFKEFTNRQLQISNDIVEYLMKNLARDINSVIMAVEKIDRQSFEENTKITIPFIKKTIL